jgi:hypothetical protein
VHGRDEFWSRKHERLADGGSGDEAVMPIHVPLPPYWPILLAGSLLLMASGALVSLAQVVIGGLLTIYCIVRFAMEFHRRPHGYLVVPEPGSRSFVGSMRRAG